MSLNLFGACRQLWVVANCCSVLACAAYGNRQETVEMLLEHVPATVDAAYLALSVRPLFSFPAADCAVDSS